jgi:hypothetical protein
MEEETKLYGKRDDFTFPIVNFLFISSNIPESPAYIIHNTDEEHGPINTRCSRRQSGFASYKTPAVHVI